MRWAFLCQVGSPQGAELAPGEQGTAPRAVDATLISPASEEEGLADPESCERPVFMDSWVRPQVVSQGSNHTYTGARAFGVGPELPLEDSGSGLSGLCVDFLCQPPSCRVGREGICLC